MPAKTNVAVWKFINCNNKTKFCVKNNNQKTEAFYRVEYFKPRERAFTFIPKPSVKICLFTPWLSNSHSWCNGYFMYNELLFL